MIINKKHGEQELHKSGHAVGGRGLESDSSTFADREVDIDLTQPSPLLVPPDDHRVSLAVPCASSGPSLLSLKTSNSAKPI